jgi:hypothetical protein
MLVKKALYKLKSSGATFCALLSECFNNMGYNLTLADLDVYLCKADKLSGIAYYEMTFCYMDDIPCLSQYEALHV